MKFQAVIFDLFGTLVDNLTAAEYDNLITEVAEATGAPREDFAREWVASFDKMATGFFGTWEEHISHICRIMDHAVDEEHLTAAAQILPDYIGRLIRPRPDAVETISRLKSGGYRIGMVSDCSMEIPLLWPGMPFSSLIDAPIFSCAAGVRKPDPQIFRLVCRNLSVAPEHCLYIGDGGSRELSGAAKVGMHSVLISVPYDNDYDHWRQDAIEWQGPRISALGEVLQILNGRT